MAVVLMLFELCMVKWWQAIEAFSRILQFGGYVIWAALWQNQQNDCAPSEDSDMPGHPPSLISVSAVRSVGSWGSSVSSCGQRRLWSDWADAQADLSLRWAQSHFVGFVICSSFYVSSVPPSIVITSLGKELCWPSTCVATFCGFSFFLRFLLVPEEGCDLWLWHSLEFCFIVVNHICKPNKHICHTEKTTTKKKKKKH